EEVVEGMRMRVFAAIAVAHVVALLRGQDRITLYTRNEKSAIVQSSAVVANCAREWRGALPAGTVFTASHRRTDGAYRCWPASPTITDAGSDNARQHCSRGCRARCTPERGGCGRRRRRRSARRSAPATPPSLGCRRKPPTTSHPMLMAAASPG